LTSSEPPGYAPSGVYLITPALHNATASTGSGSVPDSDVVGRAGGVAEGEDVVSKDGVVRALIRRNSDKPTAKPIDKEITVLACLFADIISSRFFYTRISGSKAISYKRKKLFI
jgi:hypothetical protein